MSLPTSVSSYADAGSARTPDGDTHRCRDASDRRTLRAMLRVILTIAIAGVCWPAHASEVVASDTQLKLRPKAAIAATAPAHASAPFVQPQPVAGPDLSPPHDTRPERSPSSCRGDQSLCYDQNSGHIIYKPARALMPDIPGLRAENIQLRRDRIVLRYSF
jgi:hypothetical protein